jgi:hypothetical protein
MYVKVQNGQPQKYSIEQLRRDNPSVSFPIEMPADTLAEHAVFALHEAAQPSFNTSTQKVVEGAPTQVDGQWAQTWLVVEMTPEELVARSLELEQVRRAAYQQEADPLFFKWQRGEATKEAWLDKVAEIKARFL